MTRQPRAVLDASALLAYLFGEPGAEEVSALLVETCAISAVNFSEVLSKLSDYGKKSEEAADLMERQGLTGSAILVLPFDETQARALARLRAKTRRAGLSLGDCACLALASTLNLPVATADRVWATLRLGVEVRCIR